jgi:hypothetical protein
MQSYTCVDHKCTDNLQKNVTKGKYDTISPTYIAFVCIVKHPAAQAKTPQRKGYLTGEVLVRLRGMERAWEGKSKESRCALDHHCRRHGCFYSIKRKETRDARPYQRCDFFPREGAVGEALEATGGRKAEREADFVRI